MVARVLRAPPWGGLSDVRRGPAGRDASRHPDPLRRGRRCVSAASRDPARLLDRDLAWAARRRADGADRAGGRGVLARAPRGWEGARAAPLAGQAQLRRARELAPAPAHACRAALRGRSAPRLALALPRGGAAASPGGAALRGRRRATEAARALAAALAGRPAEPRLQRGLFRLECVEAVPAKADGALRLSNEQGAVVHRQRS